MESFWMFLTIALDVYPFIFLQYMPFKNRLKIGYKKTMIICSGVLCIQFLGFVWLSNQPYYTLTIMLLYRCASLISLCILTLLFVRDNYFKVFFVFGLMTPYVVTVITTGGFFAYLFRQEGAPPYMLSVLFRLALIAISFPPIYQLFKKRLIPAMEIQDDDVWKFSLPVPAMFSFISLFFLRNDYEQNGVLLAEFLGMLFIFSGCIFTCLLLLKALQRAKEKTEIAQQQKQISQLIGLQQEQYERLSQNIDYAKRARHDLRHHLSTIAGLFKENKLAELENYVEEYVGTLPPNTGLMVCENYAVNSLVSHYMARAHEEGIEVSVMLQIGNSGKISNTELCIIIGNCLENAIDGALTANEGERTIAIRGIVQHGNLIITVDNSYDGVIIEKEGRLMSRKRNGKAEGIGLVSVAAAVEKSNGQMKVEHEQSSFRVSLFLPM